jgi:hypothetical protein
VGNRRLVARPAQHDALGPEELVDGAHEALLEKLRVPLLGDLDYVLGIS